MKFSEVSGSSQPHLKLRWGKATGTYSMRSHWEQIKRSSDIPTAYTHRVTTLGKGTEVQWDLHPKIIFTAPAWGLGLNRGQSWSRCGPVCHLSRVQAVCCRAWTGMLSELCELSFRDTSFHTGWHQAPLAYFHSFREGYRTRNYSVGRRRQSFRSRNSKSNKSLDIHQLCQLLRLKVIGGLSVLRVAFLSSTEVTWGKDLKVPSASEWHGHRL